MKHLFLFTVLLATSVEAMAQVSYGEGEVATGGHAITLVSKSGVLTFSKEAEIRDGESFEVRLQGNGETDSRFFTIQLRSKETGETITMRARKEIVRLNGKHFEIPGDQVEPAQWFDISGDVSNEKADGNVSFKTTACEFSPTGERGLLGYKYYCDGVEVKKNEMCKGRQMVRVETTSVENSVSLSFKRRHAAEPAVTLNTNPVEVPGVETVNDDTPCETIVGPRQAAKKPQPKSQPKPQQPSTMAVR